MTQQRDMLGRTTQFQYDALGRMTSRIGPDGVVTRYEYDAGGRLMAVVENYILNGPVDKETNVRTAFGYDNNSNQTTSTDARSNVTTAWAAWSPRSRTMGMVRWKPTSRATVI